MDVSRVDIEYKIKLDNSPYFVLEGIWKDGYPASSDTKTDTANIDFTLLYNNSEGALRYMFEIDTKECKTPYDVIKKAVFQALKRMLPLSYDDLPTENTGEADRYYIDTIGFTYIHTFNRIWKSNWRSDHFDESMSARITSSDGKEYSVSDLTVFSSDNAELGSINYNVGKGDNKGIYYDRSHYISTDISSFSDFPRFLSMIPGFFETNYSEKEQIDEAVRRLRLLGVSEKEILDFYHNRILPVVKRDASGNITRSEYSEFQLNVIKLGWRLDMAEPLSKLKGCFPYLHFIDEGAMPMDAYLFVETLRSEHEFYAGEFKEGANRQTVSAIVFSGYYHDDYEFGSIEIEITNEGPVRVG